MCLEKHTRTRHSCDVTVWSYAQEGHFKWIAFWWKGAFTPRGLTRGATRPRHRVVFEGPRTRVRQQQCAGNGYCYSPLKVILALVDLSGRSAEEKHLRRGDGVSLKGFYPERSSGSEGKKSKGKVRMFVFVFCSLVGMKLVFELIYLSRHSLFGSQVDHNLVFKERKSG